MIRRLMLLSCVLLPAVAYADVRVVVKIESSAMKSRYAGDLQGLQTDIAAKVAVALKEYLPQWKYVTAEPSVARLEFHIYSNRATKEHSFDVIVSQAGVVRYTSPEMVWLRPGDFDKQIRKYPDRRDAPGVLAAALKKHLLSQKYPEMLTAMREFVPIAVRSEWIPVRGRSEEPRIVAAVPWDGVLGASMFRVMCALPQQEQDDGIVRMLHSQGLLKPRKFKEAGMEYDALALRPMRRVVGKDMTPVARLTRDEVQKLRPLAVYLLIFDPQGLHVAESD